MRKFKRRCGALMLLEATLVLLLMAAVVASIAQLNSVRNIDSASANTRLEARLLASAQAENMFAKTYEQVVSESMQKDKNYPGYQYRIIVGNETRKDGIRSKPVAISIAHSDNPALTIYELTTRVSSKTERKEK